MSIPPLTRSSRVPGGSSRWRHSRHNLRFAGKVRGGVESATLRMMVESTPGGGALSLSVFQVLPASGRRLLGSLSLDPLFLPRWTDLDVSSALFTPDLHFQVECTNCVVGISDPFLNVLARKSSPKRTKRENHYRTDCFERHKKQKCCRHKMQVVFKDLPGYEFILQPYDFDAGFCKGGCPYRYNPANHHASLQSLIWRQKKGAAPKPCCAPSKLDHLEIIHLDENDNTKLKVATWTNMKVIECACF